MTSETRTTPRRCIGSTRFGIEAHDADPADFPVQPSQKEGLGRMCHTHWRQYTNALRKAAVARKTEASTAAIADAEPIKGTQPEAEAQPVTEPEPEPEAPTARTGRRPKVHAEPEEVAAA